MPVERGVRNSRASKQKASMRTLQPFKLQARQMERSLQTSTPDPAGLGFISLSFENAPHVARRPDLCARWQEPRQSGVS